MCRRGTRRSPPASAAARSGRSRRGGSASPGRPPGRGQALSFQRRLHEAVHRRPHQFLAVHGRHGWLPWRQKSPVLFRFRRWSWRRRRRRERGPSATDSRQPPPGRRSSSCWQFRGRCRQATLAYVRFQRLDRRLLVAGAKDLNELLVLPGISLGGFRRSSSSPRGNSGGSAPRSFARWSTTSGSRPACTATGGTLGRSG